MSTSFELKLESRSDVGKGASRRLRRTGVVPGIIYGGGEEPQMVAMPHHILIHELDNEAFYSSILSVTVDGGQPQSVVLKDLHRHPAKPFVLHFDLLRVSATESIKMTVPLHFINEDVAPGVKAGGQVAHTITDVEVVCLPGNLPEYIEIDMANMEIGDIVHLSELPLPEGVQLAGTAGDDEHDQSVVTIHAARAGGDEEDEEAQAEGEADSGESGE